MVLLSWANTLSGQRNIPFKNHRQVAVSSVIIVDQSTEQVLNLWWYGIEIAPDLH